MPKTPTYGAMNTQQSISKRRPDIQSLRALAITLVVVAHARLPGLQGGYVGVDVFFVLSGYLISGLILEEIESTRHFNAFTFYARRLKRLLPALLVVLLSVAVVAWLIASPQQQGADAAAGQAASLWLSNFYFSARIINYFSAGVGSNLFLHTWSLAVEEQFYLVWPWLLLFLFGTWAWQGAPRSRKRLAIGLAMVALASLALNTWMAHSDATADFYLMPGRIWEFALGALTLLLRQACAQPSLAWLDRWRGRSLLNAAGGLLILGVGALYSDGLRYPGLWAVPPCIGAALVLLDSPQRQPSSPLSRMLLRQPTLQFIGDISYSLYLWHWPVLLIGTEILGSGAFVRLWLVILSIALAAVTYVAVENPVRHAPLGDTRNVFILSGLGMALAFFVMGSWQIAALQNLHSPAQARIEAARMDAPILYAQPCDTWYKSSEVSECIFGPGNAEHTVVMFGDSVLAQWFPAVAEIYLRRPGWRLIVLTKSACSAQEVSYYYPRIKAQYTVCDIWRERAISDIVALHPDVVFMGSTHYGFTPRQWVGGTRAVLDRLSSAAGAVILMSPTPELGFDGLDCLSLQANWPRWLPSPKRCESPLKPTKHDSVLSLLQRAARPYPNTKVIDLRQAICPGDLCRAQIGNTVVYRDGQHLTASFVQSLGPKLEQALRNVGVK